MIDTISLASIDFSIHTYDNKLTKRVDTNQFTGEISEKYFYNDNYLNLTKDNNGLRFHFSFPKIFGLEDNFYPLGKHSFYTILFSLERRLEDIGVEVNIDTLKVIRLDMFKNVKTKKTFTSYSDVLRSLDLKRTHRREYEDGFLLSNSLREICFYNKVRELAKRFGYSYVREMHNFKHENIIRGEVRLLRHREVQKTGVVYLKDIPKQWDNLKESYKSYINEVFRYNYNGSKNMIEIEPEVLKGLRDYAMKALIEKGREALKVFGYFPFFYVNKSELKDALREHYSINEVYVIVSKIEKSKRKYSQMFKTYDFKSLYSELREKFLND